MIGRGKLARLARISPWIWIAIVFGGQGVGAIAATLWLKVAIRDTLLPVLILFLGMAISALLAWWTQSRRVGRWTLAVPLILYGVLIFSLSSRSYQGAQVPVSTDLFHLVEYATLGLFLACSWYPLLPRVGSRVFTALVVGCGFVYALLDEFHQSFVPGRQASVIDLVYDATALAAACCLFLSALKLRLSLQEGASPSEKKEDRPERQVCQDPGQDVVQKDS